MTWIIRKAFKFYVEFPEALMKKAMNILYRVKNNLYVNLTNRCPCNCTFCIRNITDSVSDKDDTPLWLEHEPSYEEIIKAFDSYDMSEFNELVFCGYGEPTERLDLLLETAEYVKRTFDIKIRLNTNGMADLIWNKDTAPAFKGLIDTVSISLNTSDPVRYQEMVRCRFGEKSFAAVLTFAKNIKKYVPNVILSTVSSTISAKDEEKCAEICKSLGVSYRIRHFEH